MSHRLGATVVVLLLNSFLPVVPAVRGDLIRLKNGGELRGELRSDPAQNRDRLTIRTLTGATIVVDRDEIEFLARRPLKLEEYELRAKRTPQTAEAQWELAEWCRSEGLGAQRERHLEAVVALEPDHEKAHLGLGHYRHDGEWMSRDELMTSRGYVKYKGRYVTPQELELLEKSDAEIAAEQQWYRNVRLWHGWLNRYPDRAPDAVAQLGQITDPNAVAALKKYFADDQDRQFRSLYVRILERIPGPKSTAALVKQSLLDADQGIRDAALQALSPERHERAMELFMAELTNGVNPVVERAAIGLQHVGDGRAVPDLIEALVTTHRYRVTIPDTSNAMTFGSDGSFGGTAAASLPPEIEAALRTGQLPFGVIVLAPPQVGPVRARRVTIQKEHQNAQVLAALRQLTGEDFGYDKRSWQLWYAAHKSGALGAIKS